MPSPTTEPLAYATPPAKPGRLPRWLVVVGIAIVAAWLLLQILPVLSAPEPAVATRILVLTNLYEITAAALCVAAYFVVRRLDQGAGRRLSYLAVFASMAVVLNPEILRTVFTAARLLTVGRGDSEFRSFAAGLIAFAAGIVAWVRIGRSRGTLTGLPFAIAGTIGGGLWVAFWVFMFLALVIGMSHWR